MHHPSSIINRINISFMKSVNKDILKDQRALTRFILKLLFLPDTPALIQFVAGNEDYLLLCGRIVNDSNDHSRELQDLKDICRKRKYDFNALREKLTPVARAFGLVENESDYYEVLGVRRNADTKEIKKVFRKKVIGVHPDTCDQISHSGQEFISLQTAYHTLADPSLRQRYDKTLQHVNLWKEEADPIRRLHGLNPPNAQNTSPKRPGRARIFYQLGILFLLMILAVFIFDFLYISQFC